MMLRRTFIAGLLTTPAIVRASSLDFVPRAMTGIVYREYTYGMGADGVIAGRLVHSREIERGQWLPGRVIRLIRVGGEV